VRHDRVRRVAPVDGGLEDLDALAGDLRAAQARISSSVLPLYMLPTITSIQPVRGR
jgi:hypothetical protein